MTETPVHYAAEALNDGAENGMMQVKRADLERLERQLTPLLRTVQRLLGKQPEQTANQRRAEQYRRLTE